MANANTYGANTELNDNRAMDYGTQQLKHDNMQYAVDFERNVQVLESMQIDKKDTSDVSILKTENIETTPFKEDSNSRGLKKRNYL